MRKIIVDTSCLIILSKIKELSLLKLLYGEVLITDIIAKEFDEPLPDWIIVCPIKIKENVFLFEKRIDKGEASAIMLALEIPNSIIIIDDFKGRALAKELGIKVTGTIGIIISAKNKKLIPSIKPILEKIKETNFYISKELEKEALGLAEE
jgi:predicted nucleic acid-binding protein